MPQKGHRKFPQCEILALTMNIATVYAKRICINKMCLLVLICTNITTLSGCVSEQKLYSNDAIPVSINIYKDETCDVTVNNILYIVRSQSFASYGFATESTPLWTCKSPKNSARIIGYFCCDSEPLKKKQAITQKGGSNTGPPFSVTVSGDKVIENLRSPLTILFFESLHLRSQTLALRWDPESERQLTVGAIAQRYEQ